MNRGGNVLDAISHAYYDLTAAEKRAADFVMKNHDQTQYLSIAELAEACGVAEATISRFCRRLGYKGYTAFKLAIANASSLRRHSPDADGAAEGDSLETLSQQLFHEQVDALTQTRDRLDGKALRAAVDLLEQADKVLCMGQGGSMLIAAEAAHLFSTVSGKFFPVSDSHSQVIAAANTGERDVLLFFSYSGATRDMMDTLRAARAQGARVILITRFLRSPGAELADVALICGANESPLQLSSIPVAAAQMYLVDLLFSEFCRRAPLASQENRSRVAAALADKHL